MQRAYPLRAVAARPGPGPTRRRGTSPSSGSRPDRGDPLGEPSDQPGPSSATRPRPPPTGRAGHRSSPWAHALEHLDHRARQVVGNRRVRRSGPTSARSRAPQPRSDSRPTARPGSACSAGRRSGPAAARRPRRARSARASSAAISTPGRPRKACAAASRGVGHLGGEDGVRRTGRSGRRGAPRVVQAAAQELHPAAGRSRRTPASPAARRRGPRRPGAAAPRRRATAAPVAIQPPRDPADRAVDVEDLEHQLQPGPAQVDDRLQGRGGAADGPRRQGGEHRAGPAPPVGTPARRSTARSRRPRRRAAAAPRRCSTARPARPTCW